MKLPLPSNSRNACNYLCFASELCKICFALFFFLKCAIHFMDLVTLIHCRILLKISTQTFIFLPSLIQFLSNEQLLIYLLKLKPSFMPILIIPFSSISELFLFLTVHSCHLRIILQISLKMIFSAPLSLIIESAYLQCISPFAVLQAVLQVCISSQQNNFVSVCKLQPILLLEL